jgi:hypothetical protein
MQAFRSEISAVGRDSDTREMHNEQRGKISKKILGLLRQVGRSGQALRELRK